MLPVHRLIGHKEYGNTPPGGYPDRKSDPRYSMDWRRHRVANFRPRTGAPPAPTASEEDDVLIVWIPVKPGVEIPHLITGDRYFRLDSISTARKMEAAGVKSVHADQDSGAHTNFAANLRSEGAA